MSDNGEEYSSPLWRPAENDPFLIMYRRDNRSRATQKDDEAGRSIDQSNVPSTSTSMKTNGRRKTGLPQEFENRKAEGPKPKPVGSRLEEKDEDEDDFEQPQAIPSTSNDNRTDSRAAADDDKIAENVENAQPKRKFDRFRNRSGKRARTAGDENEKEDEDDVEASRSIDHSRSKPSTSNKKRRTRTPDQLVRSRSNNNNNKAAKLKQDRKERSKERYWRLSEGGREIWDKIRSERIRSARKLYRPPMNTAGIHRLTDYMDELVAARFIRLDVDTWRIEILDEKNRRDDDGDDRSKLENGFVDEYDGDESVERVRGERIESNANATDSPNRSMPDLILEDVTPVRSPTIAIAADRIDDVDEENDDEDDDEEPPHAAAVVKKKTKTKTKKKTRAVRMISCDYDSCSETFRSDQKSLHYPEHHGFSYAALKDDFEQHNIKKELEVDGVHVYIKTFNNNSFVDKNSRKWTLFVVCHESFDQIHQEVVRVNTRLFNATRRKIVCLGSGPGEGHRYTRRLTRSYMFDYMKNVE